MRQAAFTTYHYPLPAGKKYVAVQLLSDQIFYFMVELKAKGTDLFHQVCCSIGLHHDTDYFGLAVHTDGEYLFVDPEVKLSKYFPKSWKSNSGTGIGEDGRALGHLYLRVQFYPESYLLVSDKEAKHHYYLQLKHNVCHYNQWISEEKAFLLASYALQADLGSFCVTRHRGAYFSPSEYFPPWVLQRVGEDYIIRYMPRMHQDNQAMSRTEAQAHFLREACDPQAPHHLHLHCLTGASSRRPPQPSWLGVGATGIHLFTAEVDNVKKHVSTFHWVDISKLYFDKRRFEIRFGQRRFVYYAASEEVAQHLMALCQLTHKFQMASQPRLRKLPRVSEKNGYRESYIYDTPTWASKKPPSPSSERMLPGEQRVSVISTSSSNTTSGIVSEGKVHSLEDSEDETERVSPAQTPPHPGSTGVSPVESPLSDGTPPQPQRQKCCSQSDLRPRIGVSSLHCGSEPALAPPLRHAARQSQSLDSGICLDLDCKNLQRMGNFYKETCSSSASSLAEPPDLLPAICTNLNKLDQLHQGVPHQELEQLRTHSDVPLLSALCNDRTLLPPKTVPSCSRERHSRCSRPLSWHVPPTIVSSIPKPSILSRDFS